MNRISILILSLVIVSCSRFTGITPQDIPWNETMISSLDLSECSGMVSGIKHESVIWTHNDSGDKPRIFAMNSRGEILNDIFIVDAQHIDWEDICRDTNGNLYISDMGNNGNKRTDLGVYSLPEPSALTLDSVEISAFHPFQYPDQKEFPPEQNNFDCEGIFWYEGDLYFLTKHRADTYTKLYHTRTTSSGYDPVLVLIDSLDVGQMVTAADISDDGTVMGVLTYDAVLLFDFTSVTSPTLNAPRYTLPIEFGQCEALCFNADTLFISNEDGYIRRLNGYRRFLNQ